VNDPDVLFLDEPTTGIDPAGRRDVWELVDNLTAGGTTVFLTSHSMREVARLADRVGLLRDGELVTTGTPDELVAEHGGVPTLAVETESPAAARTALDATHTVTVSDDGVVVRDIAPRDIGDVATTLDEADVAYGSLTWSEPSLEDVYLSLTGETFDGALGSSASRSPVAGSPTVPESAGESTRQTGASQ
jgi:ABC-2 type transport system ATP-binding protein